MSFLGDNWFGGGAGVDDETRVRRTLLLFAAALIVVGLGGLVYVVFWADRDDPPISSFQEIGPLPGANVSTYLEQRQEVLDDADGERVAVVSLTGYVPEADARATVGPLAVDGLLAAPPGGAPSAVTGSLAEWADAQVADSRAERDEIQKLLPTVDDAQFRDFYLTEVDRLDKVVEGFAPGGALVFGLAVRGPAEALKKLADDPSVRLVDVGPGPKLAPGAALRGLRPEETTTVGDPPTRPL